MLERDQEMKTTKSLSEQRPKNFPVGIDSREFLSPKELDRAAEFDIQQAVGEEYEPLEEYRLRIVDIQRRVARVPRWDRAIYESLADLKEQVSNLQKQVEELTEAVKDAVKISNATIYELGDSQYELTTPMQIVLEEDQEETVARIPELNLYASADTDSEAINELKQEVLKLYEDLVTSDRVLGPLPKSWLETLRKLIVKKKWVG